MFEKGQKVIPVSKSTGDSLEASCHYKQMQRINQPFLYVSKIEGNTIVCHSNAEGTSGDFYLAQDLILYSPTLIPYTPTNQDVIHLLQKNK